MPVFTLFLFLWSVKGKVFLHLNDESDLCAVAKVADSETADLLDKGLTSKLQFILAFLYQIF